MKRSFLTTILVVLVLFLASCSKNAENEHLPEYCQTYAGFTATASRDMFELLDDAGYTVNRFNYLSVISEIELEFELDDPNRTVDLGGIQCFQNLTSLSLSGRSFKDISEISALSNIQAIQLRNTSIVSIDSFKNLSKINHLVISETKTLQNVEGVGEMTKLTTLDLSNNGLVNIGELNALVNLQHLYLDHNDIIYFPSINNLEQLETLDISNNDIIQLGEDLSGLRNLEELNASNNQICDISTLDDLERVEELDLSYNDLGCNGVGVSPNFDSLENAVNLRVLKLNNNGLTSIEGLRDRDISLEVLHLHNNDLSDITPISAYTNITELILYNNSITNLNDLSGMTGLTSIDVSDNNISSLTDLLLITGLTHIDLSENNITTIPDISGEWPSLSVLDLHSNPLVDVSGVEGHPSLETLILYNSGLTVLEGISNLPELDTLVIVNEDIESELDPEDQNPNVISTLIDSFNNNPSLSIQQDFVLNLGFEFGNNVEIYNSIQGNVSVGAIDWSGQDIRVIDSTSIQLPNLVGINLSNNRLTDISFILGNPDLELLYLSGNMITNISVINGTDTEDLDQLRIVEIENNMIGSNLQNAFIDLPNIEEISLTGTPIIIIDNSFNNLSSLISLEIDGGFLQTITDSFNQLYSQYRSTNQFAFDGGDIATINNSFNGGQYHTISITNQSPIIGVSSIIDSFNDLNMVGDDGIDLSGNAFGTIIGSFQRVISDVIDLSNNELFSVTTSFNESEIVQLTFDNNILHSVPGLAEATEIQTLNLDNNELTTLSFIDGISGLILLSFLQQQTNLGGATLTTLDGINNQPGITSFTGDLSGITSITGLQNTGITDLDLSRATMGVTGAILIGPNAFLDTPLVSLNLEGHTISDLTFFANLSTLEQLNIGLDVGNLSDFIAQPMELTLIDLIFTNVSPISDFSALSGYDFVESLTLPSNSIHINFLDGMDALSTITLNADTLSSISDSFNDLPSFEPTQVYLDSFPSLTTVTRSFDLYGSSQNTIDFVTISGDYTIVDSFRNVLHVTIENNTGDVTPTFDSDSFVAMESIFFESAGYISYSFLNGYSNLTSITISELESDIVNLSNINIDIVSLASSSLVPDTISITMAENGTFLFNSLAVNTFNITVNASDITVEADNGNIVLNALNTAISLDGESDDFTLNGTNLVSVELGTFNVADAVFNTPLLDTITRSITTFTNASTVDINSNVSAANYDISATTLNIFNNALTTLTIVNEGNQTTIHDGQSSLTVNATVDELTIDTDNVTSVLLSGTINDLTIDSSVLTSLDTGTITVPTVTLTSNQASLTIIGSSLGGISITNNALSSITAEVSGTDVTIDSTNASLVVEDTSNIGLLDLTSMNNLSTIDYGLSTISDIEITSFTSSMSITGSEAVSINYTTATLDTLILDTPLSNITISNSSDSVTVDGTIASIQLDGTSLNSLVLSPGSSVTSFTILNGTALSSMNVNDSTIDTLNITTDSTTFTLTGSNISTTTITGLSLENAIINVGTNDVILTTGTASLSLDGTASTFSLSSQTDTITVGNGASFTTLNVASSNLLNIATGSSSITTLAITDSSTALILSGTGLDTVTINTALESIVATLDIATALNVTSSAANPLGITTNTSAIDVTASVDTTITGSVLDTVTVALGTSSLTLDMDKTALSATITGSAGELSITGDDITGLSLTSGSSFDVVNLTNLNLTTLDTTGSTIPEIQFTTLVPSLTIVAPTATTIGINGANLQTLSITADSAALTMSTNQTSLSVSGITSTLDLTGATITSLNVTGYTVTDMNLIANNMTTLDTGSSIQSSLTLETDQASFDLTTNAPTVGFTSSVSSDLTLTSNLVGTINLTTNSTTLTFDAPNTSITLIGTDLTTISGTVDTLNASDFTVVVLSITMIGTDINITGGETMLSLIASGTMSNLTITGTNISSFVTTGLSVTDTLTITDTSLTTLSFASTTLLNSVSTINFNTLDAANVEDILSTLDGLTLTLVSPLTEANINTYYYNEELTALNAQEDIDNAYYNGIRTTAIEDSWAEIVANQYMDHLDETTTKTAIDDNTLGDEDFYFNSYLTDAGITVDDLVAGEETTIRNAITATLNAITALMDETTLQNDTTAAIEADATTYADTETSNITFIIG